ncbi:MAG TPA: hypothetical protein VLL52_06965 [Anaerolineae bacterium]|nr:hypothetical protein [Anaerolineae bacterium]
MTYSKSIQKFQEKYIIANKHEKTILLAALCFYLTLSTREALFEARQNNPNAIDVLAILNEFVHRVSSQNLSILDNSGPAYPNDTFIEIIFGDVENRIVQEETIWAMNEVIKKHLNK